MIDLVITHLTHPWGPPWTLETLGDPWRPLATLGDMLENDHFEGNWSLKSPEIPIKHENLSPNAILLSITLKKFLWPPLTQSHGWLRDISSIQKKVYFGTP